MMDWHCGWQHTQALLACRCHRGAGSRAMTRPFESAVANLKQGFESTSSSDNDDILGDCAFKIRDDVGDAWQGTGSGTGETGTGTGGTGSETYASLEVDSFFCLAVHCRGSHCST